MIDVVRLGSPRRAGEGLRLGTVRHPPRGVPKSDYAKRDFFDVWLPDLAPGADLLAWARSDPLTAQRWKTFARRYRREMKAPAARRLIALLAVYVNHKIYFVDRMRQLKARGLPLAEAILQGKSEDFFLPEHPIALMVAASLAAHYEAIGDLIGNRIYRDLNRAYIDLIQDRKMNALQVEKLILRNLERDPFNPWFIQLGRWVSKELDILAVYKPAYYDSLKQNMERLPEMWNKSPLGRALEEKIVGKFRKNPLR